MQFSRSHAGMLGLISIFTGMIAPSVSSSLIQAPYPLTNMRWIAYVVLIIIVIDFYLVSMKQWRGHRNSVISIVTCIVILAFMTVTNTVIDLKTNTPLMSISWGWLFFSVGIGLLIYTIQRHESEERLGDAGLFDGILGILGSFTLTCLSFLIVYIGSVGMIDRNESKKDGILPILLGKGQVTSQSGVRISPAYNNIYGLNFERKSNSLSFTYTDTSNKLFYTKLSQTPTETGNDISQSVYPLDTKDVLYTYGKNDLIKKPDASIYTLSGVKLGKIIYEDTTWIAMRDDATLRVIDGQAMNIWTGITQYPIEVIAHIDDPATTLWTQSGILYKNGIIQSGSIQFGERIDLSTSGRDTIILSKQGDQRTIFKNGIQVHTVYDGFMSGSYRSNGSHWIYTFDGEKSLQVVYDGILLESHFDEVREVFLSKDGGSYGFFGRPLGEKKYCLFTRYSGNLCGLDGYMNPVLSADGTSIIYAGLKEKIWRIYRNTYPIVQDSKYNNTDISGDYVFFDITNPRTYLFMEKTKNGTYILRKNGKIIPKEWRDVGIDVFFGYDNAIILTAQDASGWHIIEI